MAKETKIIPEEIHLFHLDVLESSIKDLAQAGGFEFNLKVAHTIMHNLKEQRVKIGLLIDLNAKDNTQKANAHFSMDFHFQIEHLGNFYEIQNDGSPLFSGLLISTLFSISFSTARGVIYERLSNTNLQGILLPVINPKRLLVSNQTDF